VNNSYIEGRGLSLTPSHGQTGSPKGILLLLRKERLKQKLCTAGGLR